MKTMRVKLKDIRPNPFRDFDLYPIDEEQVRRLQQSIDSLGFFSGVTARRKNGVFELAAGHHRVKAADNAGLTEVEAVVEDYTDDEMVDIMTVENLTQKGHNAASVLDSVAARCKIIAKDILLGDGPCTKILVHAGPEYLTRAQSHIAQKGPGNELVYQGINKFSKENRRANKDAENITSTEIDQALASLKNGGVMGQLMGDVYAEVEAVRAEKAAAAAIAAEKELKRQAELIRRTEEQRQREQRQLEQQREAEEKARQAAETAKATKERHAEEKAREAARLKQARIDAEKEFELHREEWEAERAAAKKAANEEAKRKKAEAERLAQEREAIKAQRALEAIYDTACVHVFRLTSHEKAFRDFVLSDNGRRFIPRNQQLPLAKQIRKEIDQVEGHKSVDLGSVTIVSMLNAHLLELIGMQKKIDKDEKDRLLRENSQRNVETQWVNLRNAVSKAEGALGKIVDLQKSWPYDKALFPMHLDDIDRVIDAGQRMEKLKKALGY